MKKKDVSNCCKAEVKVSISPDFLNDEVEKMMIGTAHYICLKCKKPCDIIPGVK